MPLESNTSSVISFCVSAVVLAAAQILQESWRFFFEFTARFASLFEMSDKQDDFAADVCSNCTGRLAQLLSPPYRCGRSGVRLPGRSNRHSVANDSPSLRRLFGAVWPRRCAAGMGTATRYTLGRNTASIMKI